MTFDLKATRKLHKLSREAFAELTGISPAKQYNLEKGRSPKPDEAVGLEQFAATHEVVAPGEAPPAQASPAPPRPASADEPAQAGGSVPSSPIYALTEEETDPAEEQSSPSAGPPLVPKYDGTVFSNSEIKTFKRCRRKWYVGYYLERGLPRPEFTGPRALGTRVHAALADFYVPAGQTRVPLVDTIAKTLEEDLMRASNPEEEAAICKEGDLAYAMVEGYMEWLAETGADEYLEIIGSEQQVLVDLPAVDGVKLIGKLDVRVRRTLDGARMFMDHKTVQTLKQPILHLDEQMLYYHLLEMLEQLSNETAERTDGAIYNMLRKVKRFATATPPFYDRVEVHHNLHELRAFYQRVVAEIIDIIDVRRRLDAGADRNQAAYPNPTKDCSWDCDFFHVCPMFDDGSRVDNYLNEVLVSINPLHRYQDERTSDA